MEEKKMEDKIKNELCQLNIEQTDHLLENQLFFEIDPKDLGKIKASVFKKTREVQGTNILKKIAITVAAAVLLISVSTAIIGVDNVAVAITKLFSYIPGYGIVENNMEIKYIAKDNKISTENDEAILTLRNILATDKSISIAFDIKKKNFNEDIALEEKKKEMGALEKGGTLKRPEIKLVIGDKEYLPNGSSTGGGGEIEHTFVNFDVPEELINEKTTYTLKYTDLGMSLDFLLRDYDSYDKLEEIGPTDIKNNISITAVSEKKDNKLEVELYALNKSKYNIYSYTKENDIGYEGKNLYLGTDIGKFAYSKPGSYSSPNNKFSFDIPATAQNLVLKIPYLIVESDERKVVQLDIPKEGEILKLNKEVVFEDSTMVITQVELINRPENGERDLRIYFSYKNQKQDMIFKSASFNRVNVFRTTMSGGYATIADKNEITSAIEFQLDKGETKKLRLSIAKPQYYLLGEYDLEMQVGKN